MGLPAVAIETSEKEREREAAIEVRVCVCVRTWVWLWQSEISKKTVGLCLMSRVCTHTLVCAVSVEPCSTSHLTESPFSEHLHTHTHTNRHTCTPTQPHTHTRTFSFADIWLPWKHGSPNTHIKHSVTFAKHRKKALRSTMRSDFLQSNPVRKAQSKKAVISSYSNPYLVVWFRGGTSPSFYVNARKA